MLQVTNLCYYYELDAANFTTKAYFFIGKLTYQTLDVRYGSMRNKQIK